MKLRKIILRSLLLVFLFLLGWGIYFLYNALPIASGFGAKILCSGVFVSGRNPDEVIRQDLSTWPFNILSYEFNLKDSSATSSCLGMFKRKAIYRHGLGATIISELTETDIRNQKFNVDSAAAPVSDSIQWMAADTLKEFIPPFVNRTKLEAALDYVFNETDSSKPIKTRAVLVLYEGKIVAERYAPGFTRNSRLMGWSMTKSITGALVGILVKKGMLKVDAPAPVPEWSGNNDPRHKITLKNLLQQSSGLNFYEEYAKPADANRMLSQKADMGAFAASKDLKNEPGTKFYYSSGTSNILARIIRQQLRPEEYYNFPYKELFRKCGMYSMLLEPDASGTFVGSSLSYATARDWARLGMFFMNDGVAGDNERLLPEGWMKAAVTPAGSTEKGEYGYQLWLNAGRKGEPGDRMFPSAPTDLFYAAGYEGQHIFMIPSKKLLIVRLGLTQGTRYDADGFLQRVLSAFANP